MSLIVIMETDKGLLVAGDSRLTYTNFTPYRYTDNTDKVFICDSRMAIAFHGDANISNYSIENILKDFTSQTFIGKDINDVATELLDYIKRKKKDLDTWFYIAGYTSSKRQIYRFNLKKLGEDVIQDVSSSRYITGEDKDVAWDIVIEKYEENKIYSNAITFIDFVFEESMKQYNGVGGEVDILLISKNNVCEWIRKK